MAAWIDEKLHHWLKVQAAQERRNVWELVEEAIEDLKRKREQKK